MGSTEAVVLRRELAAVIAASNEDEDEIARPRGEIADRDVRIAAVEAENEQLRSRMGEKDETIALLKGRLADAGIRISDLERREAYHDSSNVPPSNRSLTLLQMRREGTEARRRASTGRGPGREDRHPGTTYKLDTGGELERRRADAPAECPKCGYAHFRERHSKGPGRDRAREDRKEVRPARPRVRRLRACRQGVPARHRPGDDTRS